MAVKRPVQKAAPRPTPRALAVSANMSFLAIVLVSLLWRLPSLFDPPWVNDEGTYFAVAQAMARGYRLYADVWENKPPGLYLLYGAVYHSFGASLITIRIIAALLSTLMVVLTYRLALRPAGSWAARAAALCVGLILGVPFLEGTTLNAELPLAALSACAMYAALEMERPAVAGICMVAAMAFKAVAGFDASALGIWLQWHRRNQLRGYMFGAAATLFVGGLAVWHVGILEPMLRDALLYDLGYVGHGNGGSVPWLLGLKLLCLFAATLALKRAPPYYLWSVWAVVGALFSGRVFGHYTLQAVVPLTISGAVLLRRYCGPRLMIALPCGFLACGLVTAVAGWSLAATGHDSILARRLQYYANFGRYALQTESYTRYESQLDDHVSRNQQVASSLTSLPAGKLLVWGNTPWIYVLSRRLPATPYTSSVRQPEVPGETAALRRVVSRDAPAVVVLIAPPSPRLGAARSALRHRYRIRGRVDNATIYERALRP